MENKEQLIQILTQIAEDMEKDASEMDGQPFNGKTVATHFGYQAAAIKALADTIKELISEDNRK